MGHGMSILGFIFGIFGLMAYLEMSSLKKRVNALEDQLARTKGTPGYEKRSALLDSVRTYIGQKVNIDLREDYGDVDIMMYGNSKHGGNTILDVDEEWMLVRIESPKGVKDKLIRLAAIERISVMKDL